MKKRTTSDEDQRRGKSPLLGVVSMRLHTSRIETGIEVQEDELGAITAQQLYRMRCECGRSWFELELRKLTRCPACCRLGLITSR